MHRSFRLGGFAAAFALAAGAAQALTIDVVFDGTSDDTVTAPFVGSATLTLDGFVEGSGERFLQPDILAEPAGAVQPRGDDPLADGIYILSDFEVFQFTAVFDDAQSTFTENDLEAPLGVLAVEIRTTESGRTFGFGIDPVVLAGLEIEDEGVSFSVDLETIVEQLTFAPGFGNGYFASELQRVIPFSGSLVGRQSLVDDEFNVAGTFGPATTPTSEIPVPAALPLMALGLAALGAAARRRRG